MILLITIKFIINFEYNCWKQFEINLQNRITFIQCQLTIFKI
ncbi:hypothetical protein pb186bvf_016433 [Paramecium bursaria]